MAKYFRERGFSIVSCLLVALSIIAAFGSQEQLAYAGSKGSCNTNCSCYGLSGPSACAAANCGSTCNTCPASTICTVNAQNPG